MDENASFFFLILHTLTPTMPTKFMTAILCRCKSEAKRTGIFVLIHANFSCLKDFKKTLLSL